MTNQIDDRLHFIGELPVLRISANSGKGVHKLLPVLSDAIEDYHRRVPTREVNKVIARPPNQPAGTDGARVLYAMQGAADPPTFTLFANRELPADLPPLPGRTAAGRPRSGQHAGQAQGAAPVGDPTRGDGRPPAPCCPSPRGRPRDASREAGVAEQALRARPARVAARPRIVRGGRAARERARPTDDLPADGVVTGIGTIDGRPVCVMANDPTVKAGSWGPARSRRSSG